MEELQKLYTANEKARPLMDEAEKAKRESERRRGEIRVKLTGVNFDGERSGVASESVSLLIRVSPYSWDSSWFKTGILST